MRERRQKEVTLVKVAHTELEVGPNLDWFILTKLVLPPGWSLDATDTLILIPSRIPYNSSGQFLHVAGSPPEKRNHARQ